MGRPWRGFVVIMWILAVARTSASAPSPLSPFFYDDTCPIVFTIIADLMLRTMMNDSRIAASLLRMHFHDCFVQGCDASVLLDGPPNVSEKTAPPNVGSLRGFEVIDTMKARVEEACPNVVSCADTLALASFFGIFLSGGPMWVIPLGRRDSLGPNFALTANLAPPFASIDQLKKLWAIQKFTATELVPLSGGHTIGDARCAILDNLGGLQSTNPQLNATRVAAIQRLCLRGDPNAVGNTEGMDVKTSRMFDNSYFKQFATNNELFNSDSALLKANDTRKLVHIYANDQDRFFSDFTKSMIKMGNLNVSIAPALEIRKNCRVVNPKSSSTLQMPGQESQDEEPKRASEDLTQEEKDKFIEDLKAIVTKVTDHYLAHRFDERPLATDMLYSSS